MLLTIAEQHTNVFWVEIIYLSTNHFYIILRTSINSFTGVLFSRDFGIGKQKKLCTSIPSPSPQQLQQSSPAMSSPLLTDVIDPFSLSRTLLQSKSPASSESPSSTKNAQKLKNLKTCVNTTVDGSHATWITQLRDLYKSSFTMALSQLDTSEKSLKSVRATILDPLMRRVLGIYSFRQFGQHIRVVSLIGTQIADYWSRGVSWLYEYWFFNISSARVYVLNCMF